MGSDWMKDNLQNVRMCFELDELITGLAITLLSNWWQEIFFLALMTFLFSADLYLSGRV